MGSAAGCQGEVKESGGAAERWAGVLMGRFPSLSNLVSLLEGGDVSSALGLRGCVGQQSGECTYALRSSEWGMLTTGARCVCALAWFFQLPA